MASFGHLAVGLMAGRLHDEGSASRVRPQQRTLVMIGFGLLAVLPDADVLMEAMDVAHTGAAAHRGATHSLITALMMGILGGLIARRYGWNGLRTALAITLAFGSHGILDSFGQGGRAIPLFWPITHHRFMAPWRCLPDAPRGLQFLSRRGVSGAALEFLYFLPVTAYALWPRRAATPPKLAIVDGGAVPTTNLAPTPAATIAIAKAIGRSTAPCGDDLAETEQDEPSLRSLG